MSISTFRDLRKLIAYFGRIVAQAALIHSRAQAKRFSGIGRAMRATTIEEPARQVPLYGEYEVVVLGGGPAGIVAAAGCARRAAHAADRALRLSRRHGHREPASPISCGLHGNVHGHAHRLVQGMASELLARIDRLNGLNAPHLILGKVVCTGL